MKCFYHRNDHDGHCSKEIVRLSYPKCELIGVNYGDDIDPIKISKEKEIIFVCDFCFNPFNIMEELSKKCNVILIDHHVTTKENVEKSTKFKPKKVVISMKESGCELTWKTLNPDKKMPKTVRWLGRYDTFDINYSDDVLPFEYGLRSLEPIDARTWKLLFDDDPNLIDRVIKRGKVVLDYINDINSRLLEFIKETTFEGFSAYILNANGDTGLFFRQYQKDVFKTSILITYKRLPNGQWSVGLVTDRESNINVGAIAAKYGGGGHRTASGFSCKELPFDI